jgi:hypothetical protein
MIINIAGDFRIDASDGTQFTLQELHISGKGVESWKNIGYYGNLASCCVGALNKCVLNSETEPNLRALAEAITNAGDRIVKACEGAFNAKEAASFEGETNPDDLTSLFEVDDG